MATTVKRSPMLNTCLAGWVDRLIVGARLVAGAAAGEGWTG
jgi:hypothetical protein